MDFTIPKNQIKENIGIALRTAGYHKISKEPKNSELNYAKPLSRAGYPRFHIYLKENKTEYVFSLHLDQKKPVYPPTKREQVFPDNNFSKNSSRYGVGVYKGAKAHSGEYDNDILRSEKGRIIKKIT